MSVLTEVTIWTSTSAKPEAIEQFNSLLPTSGGGLGGIVAHVREIDHDVVTDQAGGSGYYCGHLFAAMFNHIDLNGVIDAFYATDWGLTNVVMIVDHEFDDEPWVFLHNVRIGGVDVKDRA